MTQFIQVGKTEVINTAHIIRAYISLNGEMRVVLNESIPPSSQDTFSLMGWEYPVSSEYVESVWAVILSMRPYTQIVALEEAAMKEAMK